MNSNFPSVPLDRSNNYYSHLQVDGSKCIKSKAVESSTQTACEIKTLTETNDVLTSNVKDVAENALNQSSRFAKRDLLAPKYPLKHVNFEVIEVTDDNILDLDEDAPELAPYFLDAGEGYKDEVELYQTIPGKIIKGVINFTYWNAVSISNFVRTTFYRTENELLRDICDPYQDVRVSNSWFFGGNREVLYGLSQHSALQTRLFNVPKWLYYEGITSIFTSDRTATLKLFQVFPHVLEDRISDLNNEISVNVEKLARTSISVLENEKYDNVDFLSELENDLKVELDRHVLATAEFIIHKTGEVKPGLKKVQIELNKQIERHFPEGGGFLDRKRYHIDALKIYSDRFFKLGDAIAQETIEAHHRVINESARYLSDSLHDRKERIYILIRELLELRAHAQTSLDQYKGTRKEFERILKS